MNYPGKEDKKKNNNFDNKTFMFLNNFMVR